MNSLIEDFEDWAHHRHHQTSAAPAAATATIEPNPQEEPVISVAEIENDVHNLAAKFEQVDKAALTKLDAVQANPKTAEAFELIASVAHVDPGPFFDSAVSILRLLTGQPAQQQPAGPVIAGQA